MKNTMRISRVLAIMMVVCILFSCVITANAAVNQKVTDAKTGVVQIQVWFRDEEAAVEAYLHSGTGFLINEDTVVTCQHVATGFPDDWYVAWAQETNAILGGNRTAAQVKENLELRISVYRDLHVKATVKTASTEMDYAILTLDQKIHDRKPLEIRDSADLKQTENVYALGFPADIVSLEDASFFDSEDVTITSGAVNKVGDMSFTTTDGGVYDSVNCVESSALITGGNSGGPLVDENGAVVGINAAGNETRNLAVSSGQLIKALKALGIEYNDTNKTPTLPNPDPNPDPVPTPDPQPDETEVDVSDLEGAIEDAEEKAADKDKYTEDSYKAYEDALSDAKDALKSDDQDKIDDAVSALNKAVGDLKEAEKEEEKDNNMMIIIIIAAAAAVVVILIIVLIVVMGKKSKAKAAPAPAARPAAPAPAPAARPVAPAPTPVARPVAPAPAAETTVLSQGAGETTVLSQGAGETTVLSQMVNGGTLVRTSNNERIPITTASFTVGRERTKVDYCVGGNSNISRIHARFVVRDGATYLIDNKAANGTFVNGIKANPGQEIQLKSGDKIVLADEKFEFIK